MASKLIWDTIFSTYWWEIELNPAHPDNRGNGHTLTGYSKAQGHSENHDKHQLLLVKVRMFVQQGYLKRCNKISIYHRYGSFIEKKVDNLVAELVPQDFCIYPEYPYDRLALSKYLKSIYQDVLTGKSIDYLLPLPKEPNKDYSRDTRLDIHKYFFDTFHDLQIHCEKLTSEGFPAHLVKHFLLKYVEKYPNLETRFRNEKQNQVAGAINNLAASLTKKM